MKLGEALSQRARQAQRLNDLRGRIKANCLVQEGDSPSEDPEALIAEYLVLSSAHAALVSRIAHVNMVTSEADTGDSLLEMLHKREDLIRARNIYGMAASAASPGQDRFRFSRGEIKMIPSVSVTSMREGEEELSSRVHELDMVIQRLNWSTEI